MVVVDALPPIVSKLPVRSAKKPLPAQSVPEPNTIATDGYSGSALRESAKVVLPPTVEPDAKDLTRGYLWRAVPLPGPIDTILGAVVSLGPMPKWLGLEPAPRGKPEPQPLEFQWNQASQGDFAQQAQGLEDKLRDPRATETGKRALKGGSNDNFLITLSNGVSAIWTPTAGEKSGEKPRPNIPRGTQAKREEAAYLVDKRLGHLARVPPAVSSGLEGRPGALKLLVSQGLDGKESRQENLPGRTAPEDYRRIALFDHVVGNLDRHSGNYLVDAEERPIPIDHGLAFPVKNGEQGTHNFKFDASFQLNDDEKATLRKFSAESEAISEELSGLLEPKALEAMFARVDRMLELGWISHEWRGA